MDSTPAKQTRNIRSVYFVFLLLAIVVIIWWMETPAGILGKADSIGYAVCHRISLRSFDINGRPMPLCSRCSGMYLGAVAGILIQLIFYPRRGCLPGWKTGIPFIIFVLAFGVDGLNSYLHLFPGISGAYTPQNWLRLITGTGMGIAIAVMLVPAFHQTVWRTWDPRPIFSGWKSYAGLLAGAFMFGSLVLIENSALRYSLALISTIGVILILMMVYSMVWMMIFHKDNQTDHWTQLLPYLAIGAITAMVQIGLIDWLRFMWTGSWSGFSL